MAVVVLPLAALFRRADPVASAISDGTVPEGNSAAFPSVRRAPGLDPHRGDMHAAFLAVVRSLPVHRPGQLFRLAAPARLCH